MECADALKRPQGFTSENKTKQEFFFYQEPLPQVIVEKRPYIQLNRKHLNTPITLINMNHLISFKK